MDDLKGRTKDQLDVVQSTNTIHESFNFEATQHQLSRKRQAHKVARTISRAAPQSDEIHLPNIHNHHQEISVCGT